MNENKEPYITVTYGMRGWFAVYMYWNSEGFWEPWVSSELSHKDRDSAISEAKLWAANEGIRYGLVS